jgi:hypothetical protein
MDKQVTNDHARASSSKRKIVTKPSKPTGKENMSSSDFQSDEDDVSEYAQAPTFNGRRVAASSTTPTLPPHASTDNDAYFKTLEKKYWMPLIIGQERLEKMMKSLYANQMKIQKALNKRQVAF